MLKTADVRAHVDKYELAVFSIFSFVFYMALYFYLDAVIPNEYGTSKPWLLCLSKKNKVN